MPYQYERMEPKKTSKRRWIIAALVILGIVFIGFFLANLPRRLYPGEVRDYQGENLSSISDVQENAIRGNQFVNESTYRLTVTGLVNETKEYTYSEVVHGFQSYEKVVTLYCVEAWNAKILWEGVLVRDYNGKFETTAFKKFLRSIYEKWVIASSIEHYEDKIIGACDEFLSQTKAYLDLEGKR